MRRSRTGGPCRRGRGIAHPFVVGLAVLLALLGAACTHQAEIRTITTTTSTTTTSTASSVPPASLGPVTMQVPAIVVPGSLVTIVVRAPNAIGQRVELSISSPDGCASIGSGSGTVDPRGDATFDAAIPAFLVRNGCSSGPAVHRALSDALVVTLRPEHSEQVLATARIATTPPTVGVVQRVTYAAGPPCGGVPNLVLGDRYWRPRDIVGRPDPRSFVGEFTTGWVVMRSANEATFVGDDGTSVELVPARDGEVELC